ncbi:MAG: single-stranded DNA-binding protein [Deltaproteobacteria bacterium]|nr:MAG: single-stranded DNA-binding protein [Deltaproteobacteria bacterium]
MKDDPITISRWLAKATANLTFSGPVSLVYRPLHYAWEAHEAYLRRYGAERPRRVVLLGMNPGPWGMAQTGVPFGAVRPVREWLGISAPIGRPEQEHPARPVRGLACRRNEVSGSRLWGWAQRRFEDPARFFSEFFVANYCPLLFLEASGRNRTPDRLPKGEREALFAACDEALTRLLEWFAPTFAIGIGVFAESRIRLVLEGRSDVTIGRLPHPSPANPAANRGWSELAERALREIGVFA